MADPKYTLSNGDIEVMSPASGRIFKEDNTYINITDYLEVSERGTAGVAVFVQDQTTDLLSVPFLQTRAAVTLAADTVTGSRTIELVAGHGTNYGEVIEIAEPGTSLFLQAQVIDPAGAASPGTPVPGNTITLDQPVNRIYTVANHIALRSTAEMNVNGAVTPQIFSILPLPSQIGDMVRIIFEIRDTDSMDFETFGSLPALNSGVVIRIKKSDGTFKNLYNFKSNGDIIEQCFDHSFQINTGNNVRGFTARLTWGGQSKHGVVIRLDGALGEELQIVIQDDLTGLDRFHLTAQGHEPQ